MINDNQSKRTECSEKETLKRNIFECMKVCVLICFFYSLCHRCILLFSNLSSLIFSIAPLVPFSSARAHDRQDVNIKFS